MTLVVETSIGVLHIFMPIDRDHGEALGRRDAFEQGMKTALGEARRRRSQPGRSNSTTGFFKGVSME